MKAQSNIELPKEPQRWKEGQVIYYFNHIDNGVQKEGEEGRRYEAEFVIAKDGEIEKALTISLCDPNLSKLIAENIEVERKPSIDVVKEYTITKGVTDKIKAIFLKTPIIEKPVIDIISE